jgi:hypothetical protein
MIMLMVFAIAVGLLLIRGFVLTIHRLFLSPIAHIPGPRLAALTTWYQIYHDVYHWGQFELEIKRMHEHYGVFDY